ncbi:MAG: tRNA 5-methoxyuridine(34)/uridine 5-oxyacetic acid(34) synthase CmoB [Oligoflexales bacterium]|nr:tRNA 5-methoxyuridine(34)/uridine 5-oxyacetic acid(34) synthase CmoB [Oligoflexales bacterium]
MKQEHEYLTRHGSCLKVQEILRIKTEAEKALEDPKMALFLRAIEGLPKFKSKHCKLDQDVVEVGAPEELQPSEKQLFDPALKAFIPWKKGPFRLFGTTIDSEWRSDLKWNRLHGNFTSLQGKRVADIGCHNGYFMFRMAAQNPELVIGFEPYAKHLINYQLIQQYAQVPNLAFELLGVEHIHFYPRFFDTVFCLGILYHHTDPVGLLRKIYESLRPGGELIIDCQGIPGGEPHALVPSGRYARARGIWFLPTLSCLSNWLRRTQFRDLQCFYGQALSSEEQRRTEWAPIDSLQEFLDPNDSSKTIEGYPAPWRFYVKVKR